MKIIFLDVDGVLNHRGSFGPGMPSGTKRIAPECVAALNSIVENTGASIVVSSTWRAYPNYSKILRDAGVSGSIIGRTPNTVRFDGSSVNIRSRGEEIQQWITEAGYVEKFVILDDDDDMGDLLPMLVQTSFEAGLTESHANCAVKILGESVNTPPTPPEVKP